MVVFMRASEIKDLRDFVHSRDRMIHGKAVPKDFLCRIEGRKNGLFYTDMEGKSGLLQGGPESGSFGRRPGRSASAEPA